MSEDAVSGLRADAPGGDHVERRVVSDMIRRSLPALPAIIVVAGLIWGIDGALSAGFAVLLVFMNFALSAALLSWGSRISFVALAAAAMGGFVVRLALITIIVLAVKDQSWVSLVPLGLTLIITHLGLLVWETRHISASLAFPGLKPRS